LKVACFVVSFTLRTFLAETFEELGNLLKKIFKKMLRTQAWLHFDLYEDVDNFAKPGLGIT